MEEYIYKNIMSLATPIGSFVVCHGKEKVSFNIWDMMYGRQKTILVFHLFFWIER